MTHHPIGTPAMAVTAAAQINDYTGINPWEEVVLGLAGYDEATTARLDPRCWSHRVAFNDGSAIEASEAGWRVTTVDQLED